MGPSSRHRCHHYHFHHPLMIVTMGSFLLCSTIYHPQTTHYIRHFKITLVEGLRLYVHHRPRIRQQPISSCPPIPTNTLESLIGHDSATRIIQRKLSVSSTCATPYGGESISHTMASLSLSPPPPSTSTTTTDDDALSSASLKSKEFRTIETAATTTLSPWTLWQWRNYSTIISTALLFFVSGWYLSSWYHSTTLFTSAVGGVQMYDSFIPTTATTISQATATSMNRGGWSLWSLFTLLSPRSKTSASVTLLSIVFNTYRSLVDFQQETNKCQNLSSFFNKQSDCLWEYTQVKVIPGITDVLSKIFVTEFWKRTWDKFYNHLASIPLFDNSGGNRHSSHFSSCETILPKEICQTTKQITKGTQRLLFERQIELSVMSLLKKMWNHPKQFVEHLLGQFETTIKQSFWSTIPRDKFCFKHDRH